MTLEQLIDDFHAAETEYSVDGLEHEEYGKRYRKLMDARDTLANYVIDHADDLISWERQHVIRTSILDDGEDMTW